MLEAIGTDELDATAILDYFAPLSDFIDEKLAELNEMDLVGWTSTYENFYRHSERYPVGDNTVPIIVGSVLAALVVIVIIAYFIGRSRNRKKMKRELHGNDNPSISLE